MNEEFEEELNDIIETPEPNVQKDEDRIDDVQVDQFEKIILKALYTNAAVRNKVLPLLTSNWFRGNIDMIGIVDELVDFNERHERLPMPVELRRLLLEHNKKSAVDYFDVSIKLPDSIITDYIMEEIQDFVRRKLMMNCSNDIIKSVSGDKTVSTDFAADIADAQSFTFDESIGLDYLNELDRIYDEAIKNEVLVRSGLKTLDDLLKGGFHEKSLSLILSPTNVGKTLIMCSLATNILRQGKNVLYVTFEDSELKIGARITQNLLDVTQDQMRGMRREEYNKAKEQFTQKTKGNLIIKEYPEGTINALTLKSLLKELKEKKHFIPDIIFVDYIGCMVPNGRENPNLNSNTILLRVAAQVRALSMEFGHPIVSGAQTNRGGYESPGVKLNDVADSFGSTMKADFILGVSQTAEMKEQNMYKMEVVKTRFGNNKNSVAIMGVDISKQRIVDQLNGAADSSADLTVPGLNDDTDTGFGAAVTNNARRRMTAAVADWE